MINIKVLKDHYTTPGIAYILLSGDTTFHVNLHDLTEALLGTNSFHIASLTLLGKDFV